MLQILRTTRSARTWALAVAPVVMLLAGCDSGSNGGGSPQSRVVAPTDRVAASRRGHTSQEVAEVEVFAPENGDVAGIGGIGWFVDIAVAFDHVPLAQTGFKQFELTGPGGHQNIQPFPAPAGQGKDESLPGLVVFCSTSTIGAGANLAGLMNLVGVTNQKSDETELWDTWIVASPVCGTSGHVKLYLAEVADLDGNGVFDDAPDTVPDSNGDGVIDRTDLEALGLASEVVVKEFTLHS